MIIDKTRTKEIITINGKLKLEREYWYCRDCGHSEYPREKTLKIAEMPHKITKEMQLEIAYYAQNQCSFERASQMIERVYKVEINKETVREITEKIGTDVYRADTARAEASINHIEEIEYTKAREETLYLEIDGAAVKL